MWSVTVGPSSCPVCGGRGEVVFNPNRWQKLRVWLVHGKSPGPTLRCAEGHEWTGGSGRQVLMRGRARVSWLLWPVRAVQVLLRHRTAEPSPLFWVGAGVVGVVLGVVAQVVLSWPWWLVAVLWLAVVWLVFLATALKSLGRDGLGIDLIRTISPGRAPEWEDKQLALLIQSAPGVVYGLAGWDGLQSIGGHGRSASIGLTRLELFYGDPLEGPTLRIDTRWRLRGQSDGDEERDEREHLTRALWHHQQSRPPADLDPEALHRWSIEHRGEIDRRPIPEWTSVDFDFDGVARAGSMYAEADHWVALIAFEDAIIGIRSSHIPTGEVALTEIEDLAPYLDGVRQLRERALNFIPQA